MAKCEMILSFTKNNGKIKSLDQRHAQSNISVGFLHHHNCIELVKNLHPINV